MKSLIFILFLLLAVACVPNKKVVLLQKNDVNKNELITDKVVRSYKIPNQQYKLSAGDIVRVDIASLTDEQFDFFKEDVAGNVQMGGQIELLGKVIDSNGNIRYPVIGEVKLEGLTILEAENHLMELAANYVDDPVVKIRLLNFRVTILGEVNKPGTFSTLNNTMTFTEAVGYAGGFNELADLESIKLIRNHNEGQEIIYVNSLDEDFIASPYYYLHPNDLIIVSPLRQRPFRRYFGPNLSLFVSSLSIFLLILNTF
jgi:polysaccharide export outer membrane protein